MQNLVSAVRLNKYKGTKLKFQNVFINIET